MFIKNTKLFTLIGYFLAKLRNPVFTKKGLNTVNNEKSENENLDRLKKLIAVLLENKEKVAFQEFQAAFKKEFGFGRNTTLLNHTNAYF